MGTEAFSLEKRLRPPFSEGDRAGQYSIRINEQWRICFIWKRGDALDVEIVDYHGRQTKMAKLKNIHPGEILLEEFLLPMEISQNRLARDIGVPPRRINEIVHGKRAVTADTALRLARYFGTSEAFWNRCCKQCGKHPGVDDTCRGRTIFLNQEGEDCQPVGR